MSKRIPRKMRKIGIKEELPELHALGVRAGICCGLSNKEDVMQLARACTPAIRKYVDDLKGKPTGQ